MKLRVTARATQDLSEIADYMSERSPSAASKVRRAILQTFDLALQFPLSGRRQSSKSVRKLVTRYGYLVYYTVDEEQEEIVILTVRHSARSRLDRNA